MFIPYALEVARIMHMSSHVKHRLKSFQLFTTFNSQNPNTAIYVFHTLDSWLFKFEVCCPVEKETWKIPLTNPASCRQCPRKTMVFPYLWFFPPGQLPSTGPVALVLDTDPNHPTQKPAPATGTKLDDKCRVQISWTLRESWILFSGSSKISRNFLQDAWDSWRGPFSWNRQRERLVRPSQMLDLGVATKQHCVHSTCRNVFLSARLSPKTSDRLELDDLKMNADVYPEKKEEYFCLLQYHHYHSHQSHQNPLPGMSQTTFFVAPNRKRRTSWSIAARGSYLKPTGSAGMLHCPHLSRAVSGRRIAQHQPLWNQWSIPSLFINQCEKDMTKPKLLRAMSNPCWYVSIILLTIVSHSMIMRNCVVCIMCIMCLSRNAITKKTYWKRWTIVRD